VKPAVSDHLTSSGGESNSNQYQLVISDHPTFCTQKDSVFLLQKNVVIIVAFYRRDRIKILLPTVFGVQVDHRFSLISRLGISKSRFVPFARRS